MTMQARKRRSAPRLSHHDWTEEQDAFPRENFPSMSQRELCERLERGWEGISTRAYRILGILRPKKPASLLHYVDGIPKYEILANGCWQWRACVNAKGYPIGRGGETTLIYRQVYISAHGPIPKGWTVDHLCKNRACVNLQHLEAVPHDVNVRRGSLVKLTAEDVAEICADRTSSPQDLATRYQVSVATIYSRRRRGKQCA